MNESLSPIRRCDAENTAVRTDQTKQECALEHGCPPGRDCPLGSCFAMSSASYRTPRAGQ